MFRVVVAGLVVAFGAMTAEAKIMMSESSRVKDNAGTVYAVVLDCPQSDPTYGGAEDGKIGPDRCGQCLIESNWGTVVKFPYDLTVKGVLVDETGKPAAGKMIQFFLPNGWTVKTRSIDSGYFRILLGATGDRKSKEPMVADIGTKKIRSDSKAPFYAMYLLPENFKPCAEAKKKKK